MHLMASSKFPEADISDEIEQETGSVRTLTDSFQPDTEEGGNKQYICTGTLTDDILNNQVVNKDHLYCTSVEGLSPARAPSSQQDLDFSSEGCEESEEESLEESR